MSDDKKKQLSRIAAMTGISRAQLMAWHAVEAPRFRSKNPGRPRGKHVRPAGYLSIGDARRKYGLKTRQLQEWRAEGLAAEKRAMMILINESDLKACIRKHRAAGRRWKRSAI